MVDQEVDVLQVLVEMEVNLEGGVADGLEQRLCRGGARGDWRKRMCLEEELDHTQPDQHNVCSTFCSSSVDSSVSCGCSSPSVVSPFQKVF